jgi:hypothetical protein
MGTPQHLLIRFSVPVSDEGASGTGAIVFHRWLPIGPEEGLRVEHSNYVFTLWFGKTSVGFKDNIDRLLICRPIIFSSTLRLLVLKRTSSSTWQPEISHVSHRSKSTHSHNDMKPMARRSSIYCSITLTDSLTSCVLKKGTSG